LPVLPTSNHFAVNNLRFLQFHGMEEVIGSIPIRSTKFPYKMSNFQMQTASFYGCEGVGRCCGFKRPQGMRSSTILLLAIPSCNDSAFAVARHKPSPSFL